MADLDTFICMDAFVGSCIVNHLTTQNNHVNRHSRCLVLHSKPYNVSLQVHLVRPCVNHRTTSTLQITYHQPTLTPHILASDRRHLCYVWETRNNNCTPNKTHHTLDLLLTPRTIILATDNQTLEHFGQSYLDNFAPKRKTNPHLNLIPHQSLKSETLPPII